MTMRKTLIVAVIILSLLIIGISLLIGYGACISGNQTVPVTPPPYEPHPGNGEEQHYEPIEIIEVEQLVVEVENTELYRGTRFLPNVIIYPEDASDKRFELSSDNDNIVRIQGRNWVAVGEGTANIIATATNGVTGSVLVTVIPPPIRIEIAQTELNLRPGESVTLTTTVTGEDGFSHDHITFSSSNTTVATVTDTGVITAVGNGTATITVRIGDATATVSVIVSIPATAISIVLPRNTYNLGERVEFQVRFQPEGADNQNFEVSFSGANVGSVGQNSFVVSEPGEVVITVNAAGGLSATATITVIEIREFINEIFRLTNAERAAQGLAPYGQRAELTRAAEIRAREIMTYFSHTRPDGRAFSTAFEEANVPRAHWGENLAAGQRTPEEAVAGWMASVTGHREAILDVQHGYAYMGVAITLDDNGRLYWVQTFMSRPS